MNQLYPVHLGTYCSKSLNITSQAYLKQQVVGEQAGLVLLRLGSQARDAVVAEGLRVLVGLPRQALGGRAALRRGGRGRAASGGTLGLTGDRAIRYKSSNAQKSSDGDFGNSR